MLSAGSNGCAFAIWFQGVIVESRGEVVGGNTCTLNHFNVCSSLHSFELALTHVCNWRCNKKKMVGQLISCSLNQFYTQKSAAVQNNLKRITSRLGKRRWKPKKSEHSFVHMKKRRDWNVADNVHLVQMVRLEQWRHQHLWKKNESCLVYVDWFYVSGFFSKWGFHKHQL